LDDNHKIFYTVLFIRIKHLVLHITISQQNESLPNNTKFYTINANMTLEHKPL